MSAAKRYSHQCSLCGKVVVTTSVKSPAGLCEYRPLSRAYHERAGVHLGTALPINGRMLRSVHLIERVLAEEPERKESMSLERFIRKNAADIDANILTDAKVDLDKRVKDKLQRLVRHSKCKHCGRPIRLHNGVWVHDDPDEDPSTEDYGWAKCLPNEDGSFQCAEQRHVFWEARELKPGETIGVDFK